MALIPCQLNPRHEYPDHLPACPYCILEGTVTVSIGKVMISGGQQVGYMLTAVAERVSPPAAMVSYQWLRHGKKIRGAVSRQYRVQPDDVGPNRGITCRITAVVGTASATKKAKYVYPMAAHGPAQSASALTGAKPMPTQQPGPSSGKEPLRSANRPTQASPATGDQAIALARNGDGYFAVSALRVLQPGPTRNSICAQVASILASNGDGYFAVSALRLLRSHETLSERAAASPAVTLARNGDGYFAVSALRVLQPGPTRNSICAQVASILASNGDGYFARQAQALIR